MGAKSDLICLVMRQSWSLSTRHASLQCNVCKGGSSPMHELDHLWVGSGLTRLLISLHLLIIQCVFVFVYLYCSSSLCVGCVGANQPLDIASSANHTLQRIPQIRLSSDNISEHRSGATSILQCLKLFHSHNVWTTLSLCNNWCWIKKTRLNAALKKTHEAQVALQIPAVPHLVRASFPP